jgi:hypothetical protein
MTMQEAVIKNIDTDYSYQLAKRMEQFRSNEKLGYRPEGRIPDRGNVKG